MSHLLMFAEDIKEQLMAVGMSYGDGMSLLEYSPIASYQY